ncbi:MAG: cyclase family protein, partial [Phycisphaerales bacterium]|nr:cyclase family protein [Phycisphaerales bacterium]
MCSPHIIAEVDRIVADRRQFLKTAAGGCAAVGGVGAGLSVSSVSAAPASNHQQPVTFSRTVDLTHTLTHDFPAWFTEGEDIMGRTAPASLSEVDEFVLDENAPFALKKVSYWEHVGTHVDAASHCSNMRSVDEIPVEQLVSPLVVIDIRAEAAKDPLAQVMPEHVRKWESLHGPLPPGCFVAMNSGWSEKVHDRSAFLCPGEEGGKPVPIRQPAFHPDTARMLLEDR